MDKKSVLSYSEERREPTCLKPSMFNRLVRTDDKLTLYNSARGTRSILRIAKENIAQVTDILTQHTVCELDNHLVQKLYEEGYLVPSVVDEKALRSVLQMQFITQNVLQLVVHVTRSCNFRCVYCYMDFEPVFLSEETQQGIINFVRRNINKYSGVEVSWFGGEPLLGVDIIERISTSLIEICKKNNKPYIASMTTNGYGLSPDVYERLTRCRVKNYTITIDGPAELHDRQRVLADGSPTFDVIMGNLIYIKDNYKHMLHRFNIRSNITADHYNILLKYYDYLQETFEGDSRFEFFVRRVGDFGGERVKAIENKFIYNLVDTYKMLNNYSMSEAFKSQFSDLEVGGLTCKAKKQHKYTIGCYGTVSKCDEDLSSAPLGKLYPDGEMQLDSYGIAECVGIRPKCEDCEDCYLSCSCFMEQCPLRKYDTEAVCKTNFEEIDALIELAGKVLDVEIV